MPIPEPAYAAFSQLSQALSRLDPQATETNPLPGYGDPSRNFAFWLFVHSFFLQVHPQSKDVSPDYLVEATNNFSEVYRAVFRLPLPFISAGVSVGSTGHLLAAAGTGVGGDNWCRHQDGSLVAMEIYRNHGNITPELEMVCAVNHATEYEVLATNAVHKV